MAKKEEKFGKTLKSDVKNSQFRSAFKKDYHDAEDYFFSDEEQKKPEIPQRMSRIAWPNARYGFYLAIIIIILVLIISMYPLCK